MRRISDRSFEGAAGEIASLNAHATGTAAVRVWLDGNAVGADVEFGLQGLRRVSVMLAGEPGERCSVKITTVDGDVFHDVILVTAHDPMPVHQYGFRAI